MFFTATVALQGSSLITPLRPRGGNVEYSSWRVRGGLAIGMLSSAAPLATSADALGVVCTVL